jgi:hypothetical protein
VLRPCSFLAWVNNRAGSPRQSFMMAQREGSLARSWLSSILAPGTDILCVCDIDDPVSPPWERTGRSSGVRPKTEMTSLTSHT